MRSMKIDLINKEARQKLLNLASNSIICFLTTGKKLLVDPKSYQGVLSAPCGNFVTIEVNHELHGCIGKIESGDPLYRDIASNAVAAGFYDPRFLPLTKEDLAGMTVEISLLTVPEKIKAKSEKEIINFLAREKPGVILKNGYQSATFLPQVWEKVPDPVNFLQELSLKAGMDENDWKKSEISIYRVVSFTS